MLDDFLEKPVITVVVLIIILIGGIDIVVDNTLSQDYEDWVQSIGPMLGLTALARGSVAAAKKLKKSP